MLTLSITMYFVPEISQSDALSEATWVWSSAPLWQRLSGATSSQAIKSTTRLTFYIFINLHSCEDPSFRISLWYCPHKHSIMSLFCQTGRCYWVSISVYLSIDDTADECLKNCNHEATILVLQLFPPAFTLCCFWLQMEKLLLVLYSYI